MTEEQRRQAAAKRCAGLSNEGGVGYRANDFDGPIVAPPARAFLNAVLQLDELARTIRNNLPKGHQGYLTALKHILPEPKPSPVERLAQRTWLEANSLAKQLENLGLELREKSS